MRFQKCGFHIWTRLLKEFPSADATLQKFRLQKDVATIRSLADLPKGSEVTVNGWIDVKPKKVGKNLSFTLLRDCEGNKLQLVDSKSLLKGASVEDVVQAKGVIAIKKGAKKGNQDEKATFELSLESLTTLNQSNKKPSELQDFKLSGEYPPEYRYLQLRLPKYQNIMKKRNLISRSVRDILNAHDFIEIETPLLFKSTPEGAREFLVPTRKREQVNKKPTFYALPQSPQQYKQLLMASGVNRYFQLARCFRDEDLRADRQPEFTQIDLEMSFASGKDVMKIVEDTVLPLWTKFSSLKNLMTLDKRGRLVSADADDPICQMSYQEAMSRYGVDKPDLRAPDLKIIDLTDFKAKGYINKDFPVFEILVLRNAFSIKENYERDWSFLYNPNNYNSRVPTVVPIETQKDVETWFEKFLPIAAFENPKIISKFLNLQKGDVICGCTRQPVHFLFENPTPMGRLRQLVLQSARGKELYQQTDKDVATWVIDFPLFSPLEKPVEKGKRQVYPEYDTSSLSSTHHPFTMVKLSDYQFLKSNPLKCTAQHYDLVVSGVELGGGSTRIHDTKLQNYIFEDILNIHNSEELFGHLLRAFEMGAPPHAGFAIGFDRLCAMLCGSESIRDVIAFPKSVTGCDLVVGSPSSVNDTTLRDYNIKSNE